MSEPDLLLLRFRARFLRALLQRKAQHAEKQEPCARGVPASAIAAQTSDSSRVPAQEKGRGVPSGGSGALIVSRVSDAVVAPALSDAVEQDATAEVTPAELGDARVVSLPRPVASARESVSPPHKPRRLKLALLLSFLLLIGAVVGFVVANEVVSVKSPPYGTLQLWVTSPLSAEAPLATLREGGWAFTLSLMAESIALLALLSLCFVWVTWFLVSLEEAPARWEIGVMFVLLLAVGSVFTLLVMIPFVSRSFRRWLKERLGEGLSAVATLAFLFGVGLCLAVLFLLPFLMIAPPGSEILAARLFVWICLRYVLVAYVGLMLLLSLVVGLGRLLLFGEAA